MKGYSVFGFHKQSGNPLTLEQDNETVPPNRVGLFFTQQKDLDDI
jgi:hypothetical protein